MDEIGAPPRSAVVGQPWAATTLSIKMPRDSPGAVTSSTSSSRPAGEPTAIAIERFPLLRDVQKGALTAGRDRPTPVIAVTADRVDAYEVGAELLQCHAAGGSGDEAHELEDLQSMQRFRSRLLCVLPHQ
jgi:hypothetical protein